MSSLFDDDFERVNKLCKFHIIVKQLCIQALKVEYLPGNSSCTLVFADCAKSESSAPSLHKNCYSPHRRISILLNKEFQSLLASKQSF
jgi:hypothetical protein